MPRAQVLVTLTAEAVVEVPADADIETYVRERLALEWGGVEVVEILQSPSTTVAWFEVPAAAPEAVDAAPEEVPAEPAASGPLTATAEAIGSVLGKVAGIVEGVAETLAGARDESELQAAVEPAPEEVAAFVADQAAEVTDVAGEHAPVHTADLVSEYPAEPAHAGANGNGPMDRDELLALFSDPLYKEVIRNAVRDRAAHLLESVVAEVVAELEPLLRRQIERHRA